MVDILGSILGGCGGDEFFSLLENSGCELSFHRAPYPVEGLRATFWGPPSVIACGIVDV